MVQIIIDAKGTNKRIAILEDEELVEFHYENENTSSIVGNIYVGKVMNIVPGMEVAFINIGAKKNAFLYQNNILRTDEQRDLPIQKVLKCGQEIFVQVIKDAMGTKGPKITMDLSLTGSKVVYMPYDTASGISKKITSEEERKRLQRILKKLELPQGAVIFRTAAVGVSEEKLVQEIEELYAQFLSLQKKGQYSKAPTELLGAESVSIKLIKAFFGRGIQKIIVNDKTEYERIEAYIKEQVPQLQEALQLFEYDYDIFGHYLLNSKIEKVFHKKVWLKSGGSLFIEQTEAMTVIDVNTEKYTGKKQLQDTILKINIEAAREAARQLRLRDIGGIIIIDFIDMESSENAEAVLQALNEALQKDRTRSRVYGMTRLGLVEMTRKKIGESITQKLTKSCPVCKGKGLLEEREGVDNFLDRKNNL